MKNRRLQPQPRRSKIPKLLTALPPRMGLDCLLHLINSPTEEHFISTYPANWRKVGTGPAAWKLRDEIVTDLEQLVEPSTRKKGIKALMDIVEKVNTLGMKPQWMIAPGSSTYFDSEEQKDKVNFLWPRLGAEHGLITIGKEKSMVTMIFDHFDDSKKFFYGIIINALQNGAFDYLCRCRWNECRMFFVTDDLRKKSFCTKKCEKLTKNHESLQRMAVWRRFKRE